MKWKTVAAKGAAAGGVGDAGIVEIADAIHSDTEQGRGNCQIVPKSYKNIC